MPRAQNSADFRNKLLLVNAGIFVALLFQLWRGRPLAAILLTGLIMVVLVNLVMYLARRPKQKS